MIVHMPTLLRWIRSILYMAVVSFVLFKVTLLVGPYMLPDDPYKIPAGDALSVQANQAGIPIQPKSLSSGWHLFTHELISRLKWFYLTGE